MAFDLERRAGAARRRGDSRPALALVTPWPPATTGVASYSRRLTRALSASVDIDLFIDGDLTEEPGTSTGTTPIRPGALRHVDAVRGGYDAIVASVGNSEHHTGALRLLRVDGVSADVLAHDVRLNGLYRHGGARGAVPEGTIAAVKAQYPEATDEWFKDGWLQPAEAEAHHAFMARELIGLSDRFIVTSTVAAELAVLDARPEDRHRVVVCPYAYPRAGRARGHQRGSRADLHLRAGQRGQAARAVVGLVRPGAPGAALEPSGLRRPDRSFAPG